MPGNIKSGKRPTLKLQDSEIYTPLCPSVVICTDSICVFYENMAETPNTWPVCSFPHIVTDMFASFPVSAVWLLLVYLLFCSRLSSVRAASICTGTHASCHVLSLANLFDRVIQHSTRMHSITNDLHSEFVSCISTPRGENMIVSVKSVSISTKDNVRMIWQQAFKAHCSDLFVHPILWQRSAWTCSATVLPGN